MHDTCKGYKAGPRVEQEAGCSDAADQCRVLELQAFYAMHDICRCYKAGCRVKEHSYLCVSCACPGEVMWCVLYEVAGGEYRYDDTGSHLQ